MRRFFSFAAMLLLATQVLCTPVFAEPADPPRAVLIAAFGSSVEKARSAYAAVERQVKAAFPDRRISWAWTAHSLIKTAPPDKRVATPLEALAALAAEGVKDVSVLSLHIIPGAEYDALRQSARAVEGLPKGLRHVRLAPPLLHDADSVREVAELLLRVLPTERGKDEAALFVGHGTHHPSGVYYPALGYYLQTLDANVFVGTIEGSPSFEDALRALQSKGIRKVWLAPLMTVAGDHAVNDLFGNTADSWQRRLTAAGMEVVPVAKGLGDYPVFVTRWLSGMR
jgi:sirohydrochlorin cobaltochelatase